MGRCSSFTIGPFSFCAAELTCVVIPLPPPVLTSLPLVLVLRTIHLGHTQVALPDVGWRGLGSEPEGNR